MQPSTMGRLSRQLVEASGVWTELIQLATGLISEDPLNEDGACLKKHLLKLRMQLFEQIAYEFCRCLAMEELLPNTDCHYDSTSNRQ